MPYSILPYDAPLEKADPMSMTANSDEARDIAIIGRLGQHSAAI